MMLDAAITAAEIKRAFEDLSRRADIQQWQVRQVLRAFCAMPDAKQRALMYTLTQPMPRAVRARSR